MSHQKAMIQARLEARKAKETEAAKPKFEDFSDCMLIKPKSIKLSTIDQQLGK